MSQVSQQSEVTPFDNPCVAYLSNEVLDPIFENEVLLKGFKVIWFVINNFFEFFLDFLRSLFHKILLGRLGARLCLHSIW